jgi:hypothetical protein
MLSKNRTFASSALALSILIFMATILYHTGVSQSPVLMVAQTEPSTVIPPTSAAMPKIVLQRLQVAFLGQDGHQLIGSGCPGSDGEGSITNYHFAVSNVNVDSTVARIVVAGDNSTLTWAWPCTDNWGLLAIEAENGDWDIFIAPSEPASVYTVMFFYNDHTIALGMTAVP